MIGKAKNFYARYRQPLLYLFFGGVTTLINFIVYAISSFPLGLYSWLSAAIAWVFAVGFAFIVNKLLVFRSRTAKAAPRELALFLAARISSGGLSVGLMYLFVDTLKLPELPIYAALQIIIIAANFLASKYIVFKN